MTRVLGIDLGERRIGIAVSDDEARAARPLATLRRGSLGADARALVRFAGEHGAVELVVGLPLEADGSDGPQARLTREWAAALGVASGLAVCFRDERETSLRAEARLGAPRRGRAGGPPTPAQRGARRARVDREAAALILQAELDGRHGVSGR